MLALKSSMDVAAAAMYVCYVHDVQYVETRDED